ncbi:MAG: ATP-binding cassette domain-containing protein [Candidatus Krumholzibacteria bacterium]|nr:ATP-binding cassette domain-containing protein [Candidatus Krumholzibacteria bacterium]
MKATPDPLLSLRDWTLVRRVPGGEITLLDGIDLDIRPGRWLAVLGANGSGKSSLLKYLASEESPLAESAAIMFQDPDEQIFAASVERELTLGTNGLDAPGILREFELTGLKEMNPRLLSAGQKQRLVLAVALVAGPGVLLCDEPTALQDPEQSRWVLDRLERWKEETGGALVTATCDRAEAARADWLVVLKEGRIVEQGPTAELISTPEVENLLGDGRSVHPMPIHSGNQESDVLLELTGLDCRFIGPGHGFGNVDLRLGPGERIGVTGPNGCGKSTLLASCAGARRPDKGSVKLMGRLLYARKSRELDHGVAMIAPQFPEYLFTRSTVADEIHLDPLLASLEPGEFLAALGLDPDLAVRNPHDLSSGQRRRLALGMVLLSGRPVLLLDEPTAALDRAGRSLVLDLLDRSSADSAMMIVSHDRSFLEAAGCNILTLGSEGLFPSTLKENPDNGTGP